MVFNKKSKNVELWEQKQRRRNSKCFANRKKYLVKCPSSCPSLCPKRHRCYLG